MSRRDQYRITSDPEDVDIDAVHAFLTTSYWAEGISRDLVAQSIAGSIPFSLFHGQHQVGFARVITDKATYAYIGDVYVLAEHRGKGLARWLVETVMSHPELQGLRRWALITRDAHKLYEPLGFKVVATPERHMEIARPGLYKGQQ